MFVTLVDWFVNNMKKQKEQDIIQMVILRSKWTGEKP